MGPSPARSAGLGFCVVRRERLCEICVCGGGFLRDGSCRKGILRERHDRRTGSTRPKRKSKFVTCAERPASKRQRTKVPAQKKKQVCDVCGAPSPPEPENQSTRPKRKSKFVTCAERPVRPSQRTKAPAQKEKARLDVCGAITDALPQKNSPQSEGFSI